MNLRITSKNLKSDNKLERIYENSSFLIEGDNLLKNWSNKIGDIFFLLGDIIGYKKNSESVLSKITDFSVLEEQININQPNILHTDFKITIK